ncbi:helix-turn-helix domain-containing protein [Phytohabitans rumicis]|uniref:HTH cro/C1-type domain-containing protein n=1 Tax=Phytohabitans rumicis TaxID=1076125 RepID=A0A6V8KMJ6_9ACTN|nr:helix-turn-helix domain-containing protein [Phytohabitans rumicis]GFJ86383.1 hypothetical protein Prum_000250 [Phytohabitans rumicis]
MAATGAASADPGLEGCGCGLTVVRWSGRETRALREALRMSIRAFAEHLGVSAATVSGWEHPSAPAPPRLSTQELLDQALKLAGADARTRFGLILAGVVHGPVRRGDRRRGRRGG